jgi:hypothetical protein
VWFGNSVMRETINILKGMLGHFLSKKMAEILGYK